MAKKPTTIKGEFELYEVDETMANIVTNWEAEIDYDDNSYFTTIGKIYLDAGEELPNVDITEQVKSCSKLYKHIEERVNNHIDNNWEHYTEPYEEGDFYGN